MACSAHKVKHTFRILGTVTAKGLKFLSDLTLSFLETTRGLMLLKMVMMRMLIGNMRRPLSTPTIISCQVICSDPGRRGERERGGGGQRILKTDKNPQHQMQIKVRAETQALGQL